jgi:hypothetical protein
MDIAFKSLYIKFTYKNNIQLMTSETSNWDSYKNCSTQTMAAVTPIKIKALTNVIMHFFVNFVRGGGSDKSCFNENKMLYIWVMI